MRLVECHWAFFSYIIARSMRRSEKHRRLERKTIDFDMAASASRCGRLRSSMCRAPLYNDDFELMIFSYQDRQISEIIATSTNAFILADLIMRVRQTFGCIASGHQSIRRCLILTPTMSPRGKANGERKPCAAMR